MVLAVLQHALLRLVVFGRRLAHLPPARQQPPPPPPRPAAAADASHGELLQELFAQLKFPVQVAWPPPPPPPNQPRRAPQAVDLKKRIDSLLEREYLERSSEDSNVYNYLS